MQHNYLSDDVGYLSHNTVQHKNTMVQSNKNVIVQIPP